MWRACSATPTTALTSKMDGGESCDAPSTTRGRVIGLFSMSALGLRAFSGVTVGLFGSLIGIHLSLALAAGLLLTLIVATLWKMPFGR